MLNHVKSLPVNAASSAGPQPVNSIATSQRCAAPGCDKWAVANSRFCANRKYTNLKCKRIIKLTGLPRPAIDNSTQTAFNYESYGMDGDIRSSGVDWHRGILILQL